MGDVILGTVVALLCSWPRPSNDLGLERLRGPSVSIAVGLLLVFSTGCEYVLVDELCGDIWWLYGEAAAGGEERWTDVVVL